MRFFCHASLHGKSAYAVWAVDNAFKSKLHNGCVALHEDEVGGAVHVDGASVLAANLVGSDYKASFLHGFFRQFETD